MNLLAVIVWFFIVPILAFCARKNFAKNILEEIRMDAPEHQKKLVKPNRKIRKWFKIKEKKIPRFLYVDFCLCLGIFVLSLINLIIYIIFPYPEVFIGVNTVSNLLILSWIVVDLINTFVWRHKYKKLKKRK